MTVFNVQHVSFWRQFNNAIRERHSVLFGDGVYNPIPAVAPNAGDSLQQINTGQYYGLGTLQTWIENNCQYFVRSHDNDGVKYVLGSGPSPGGTDPFDGMPIASEVEMWSWETLKLAALGGDGWTAYTTKTAHTHRHIQAGDHWKPILWIEIARCLDMLLWTEEVLWNPTCRTGVVPGHDYVSFALAEAASSALYAAGEVEPDEYGTAKVLSWFEDGFGAEIVATKYYIQGSARVEALVGCTGYGYFAAVLWNNGWGEPTNVWDAQGEAQIAEDVYKPVGSTAIAIGDTETVGTVGSVGAESVAVPNWPSEPGSDPPAFFSAGWIRGNSFTIKEWGFTILSPIIGE